MRDRDTLKQIWQQFSPIFGRILVADALFKLLIFFTLSPLTAWFFSSVVRRSGSSAVSNTDIIGFLTSPIVLSGLFISGALSFAITYAERAALMQIVFGHQQGYRVSYRHMLRQTSARIINFLGLGALIIGRVLLMLIPLAIVAGLLYFFNFREHDINYYIKVRPREVWISAAIAVPVLLLTLGVLIRYWVSWSFALPAVFFEDKPFREALPYSRELIQGNWWRVARLSYGVGFLLIFAIVLVLGLVLGLGSIVIRAVETNSLLLLITAGAMVLINWLLSVFAGFVITTVSVVITTSLYMQVADAQGTTMHYQPDHTEQIKLRMTRRRAIAVVLVGCVFVLGAGLYLLAEAFDATEHTTTVTAHRGSSAVAPPNTLPAVQQAINDGADYAEIDVQETADGMIIVNHDKDYLLAAGVARDVHELTYAETQALDVGSTFSADFANERIPTLAQVLDLAKGQIKINIELKYYGQDVKLVERVVEIVREKGMSADVLIMSLHYEGVQEIRALAPEIATGFLVSALTVGDLTELDVDFLAVSSGLATSSFVSEVHAADKEIFVWTINDAADVPTYLNLGVDSIITDYPIMVREHIAAREKMSSSEKLLRTVVGRFTD